MISLTTVFERVREERTDDGVSSTDRKRVRNWTVAVGVGSTSCAPLTVPATREGRRARRTATACPKVACHLVSFPKPLRAATVSAVNDSTTERDWTRGRGRWAATEACNMYRSQDG